MKKSLSAIIVMILSLLGAKAFSSTVDFNVQKNTINTLDDTSGSNGTGGRNGVSKT